MSVRFPEPTFAIENVVGDPDGVSRVLQQGGLLTALVSVVIVNVNCAAVNAWPFKAPLPVPVIVILKGSAEAVHAIRDTVRIKREITCLFASAP